MKKKLGDRKFYNLLEDKIPYQKAMERDLANTLRQEFILSKIRKFRGSLLDAGCSSGFYGSYYENGPYLGVDIAKEAIKNAKKRVPQGKFFVGDIQNLTFIAEKSIDNILCSEVIEHLLDPRKVFKEFFRVLKPGGKILITCPNFFRSRPSWVRSPFQKLHGLDQEFFHTAYHPQELAEMAKEAGLRVLEFGMIEREMAVMNLITYLPFKSLSLLGNLLRNKKIIAFNFWWLKQFQFCFFQLLKKVKLSKLMRVNLGPITWVFTRSYLLAEKPRRRSK